MELWDDDTDASAEEYEGGDDAGTKRTTPEPSERKHDSLSVMVPRP
jgi:hypothetical protein